MRKAPGTKLRHRKSSKCRRRKYEFTPAEIHVKVGAKVELKVHSEDETHGLKLDAFPEGTKDKSKPGLLFDPPDQNGKVTKGVDQVIDFVAQEPGTYEFKCAKGVRTKPR